MTKAMLQLVRLADRFFVAETGSDVKPHPTEALNLCLDSFSLLAGANLQMDQLRREGFQAALPSKYKALTTNPETPTELLIGTLDTRMKELDEKAKLEETLQPASTSKPMKVIVHPPPSRAFTSRSTRGSTYRNHPA